MEIRSMVVIDTRLDFLQKHYQRTFVKFSKSFKMKYDNDDLKGYNLSSFNKNDFIVFSKKPNHLHMHKNNHIHKKVQKQKQERYSQQQPVKLANGN